MKKNITTIVACLCIISAIGQVKVSATISKITHDSNTYIYTTITNNGSVKLRILEGGILEPKCNCIIQGSHLKAYFTGFSNNMTAIFERKDYPLSSPHGDYNPRVILEPGKSYITYALLYRNSEFYGIINDQTNAPNIEYLNARINLLILDQEQLKSLTVSTNTIKLK